MTVPRLADKVLSVSVMLKKLMVVLLGFSELFNCFESAY